MIENKLLVALEDNPVIAAVRENKIEAAIESPSNVVFLLGGSILTVKEIINKAHTKGKIIFVHIDLTDGIGKDKTGIAYLASCGADGIISTRANLLKFAKEQGLFTVQRFFALDSQGLESIEDMLLSSTPNIIEIMPGVIDKVISKFTKYNIPLVAGGLIEAKTEVMSAINAGALAVSTGKEALWFI